MTYEPQCTGTHTCARCHQEKTVLAYSANPANRNGLHSYCRECISEINHQNYARKRRLRPERLRQENHASLDWAGWEDM